MANRYPPRTSSRLPAPGVFMKVEFGVSFSNSDRPHTASISYASRNMQERLARQQRQQEDFYLQSRDHAHYEEEFRGPHPAPLLPGSYRMEEHHNRQRQQRRQQGLGVRTREQHERGSSAPPSLSDRLAPISPVSPISHIQHTSSMPLDGRMERPLPPLPSRFRLGEEDLPWSTEPWYQPSESENAAPTVGMVGLELENRRGEDPQRVRELETLHQAMMTVDSLANDTWDPWTLDSVGDFPRGPRSLGWAVSTTDSRGPVSPLSPPPPPPYVVSQWEQGFGRDSGYRPRSSG